MTERVDLDRAMTLAEMAPHPSVRFEVLAGREDGFDGSRLSDPPVTHLEDTEAVAYVLTNAKRGIGVGTKRNTRTPADGRGAVVLVTGRRTLCLVGGTGDDRVIEVPHDAVADVTYETGLLANRFVLRTPRKQYHCWTGRHTERSLLDAAAEYVDERTAESPDELDEGVESLPGDTERDRETTLTYRGRPVSPENHPGIPDDAGGDAEADTPADGRTNEGSTGDPERGVQYRGQPLGSSTED